VLGTVCTLAGNPLIYDNSVTVRGMQMVQRTPLKTPATSVKLCDDNVLVVVIKRTWAVNFTPTESSCSPLVVPADSGCQLLLSATV